MQVRANILRQNTLLRYLFGIAAVAGVFALRIWLIPWTGTGAPFVLFFAAVLLTSLFAGVGPGTCALGISLPLAAYMFVTRAGYPLFEAISQALLFAIDGVVVIYLTFLMRKGRDQATRSMARTREVIELAPDAFFQADLNGRFTDLNQAACRMLGYARDELIGKAISDIIPPEDVPRLAATRTYLLSPDKIHVAEWTHLRKDGRPVPVEVSSNILPDGRWQAFVRDITERKRIEQELRDLNASLDAIIEHIPVMLFMKESGSLRFTRFNRACEDVLGWPREALIGKNDYDLWPPAQAEFFVEKDRETLHGGTVVDIAEEPIQTRHRGIRILHTRKVPILDPAGKPAYLLGISEDITERRRAEKEQQFLGEAGAVLSASLDYEQTLTNVARLAVHGVADWCIVDLVEEHGGMRRLKVVSADPAQTALCSTLEHWALDRTRPYLTRSVMEQGRSVIIEHLTSQHLTSLTQGPEHLQAILATGMVSLIVVPLLMHGRTLGALLLGSSTPSHVYGQGDLRFAEALADRAAVAIENARLYRASVHATQLRDQVLGIVAHDLRNPLSLILMQAWALQRRGPDPERRSQKAREAIDRAVGRMNRLIQDLLDVARVESGQLTIRRASVSARELVAAAVDMQAPLAASSSLELRVDLDGDVPDVWGDRDRLLQVFENLIGNGIKFTKAGGCITVGAAVRNHEVVFRVADTGSGIVQEHLPRVFDRFWQATRADRQGAGLGLPITKGIVEAHGGRIWVESTLNRGTTFFFTVPEATPEQRQRAA